jgi:hypothetical protein
MDINKFKRRDTYSKSKWSFVTVASAIFCALILYIAITQERWKETMMIVSFVFSASCFLIGLWKLFSNTPDAEYIYLRGWKYKLFAKGSKRLFILLTALADIIWLVVILIIAQLIFNIISGLYFDNLLISGIVIILLMSAGGLLHGYLEYKRYKKFTSAHNDSPNQTSDGHSKSLK